MTTWLWRPDFLTATWYGDFATKPEAISAARNGVQTITPNDFGVQIAEVISVERYSIETLKKIGGNSAR